MSGLEGYTGPTSGRITLSSDGSEPIIERFTDPPLTREEAAAVAWFTALSPNEQRREVRRLKWNLEDAQAGREAALRRAREAEALVRRVEAERAALRPDGFELPRAASELLSGAVSRGWSTARAWSLDEDDLGALLTIVLGHGGWTFRLTWRVPIDGDGRGSLVRRGLFRRPGRDWADAPPLKEIRRIVAAEPDDR